MNSKKYLFKEVIKDRKEGLSFLDLSRKYGISKSTASLWCRGVKISPYVVEGMRKRWSKYMVGNRAKAGIHNKQKKIDRIEKEFLEAKKMVGTVSKRDLLIMGLGLYWAEGSKKETGSGFSFVNSDPLMVKIIQSWLFEIIGIKKEQLSVNLAINISHVERELEILKFWSNLLDFPVEDFGNTVFIKTPHRRVYDNHAEYFGMLRIRVKSSAWLRRRILGMIKVFTASMSG